MIDVNVDTADSAVSRLEVIKSRLFNVTLVSVTSGICKIVLMYIAFSGFHQFYQAAIDDVRSLTNVNGIIWIALNRRRIDLVRAPVSVKISVKYFKTRTHFGQGSE